jgi:very-short-patch-repair endonuclease
MKKKTRKNLPLMATIINGQNSLLSEMYRQSLLAYKSEAVAKIEEELKSFGVPHQRERVVSLCLNRSRKSPEMKTYFLDFFFKDSKLIVEVDGGYHSTPERILYDQTRDQFLKERRGWRTLRLTNEEVLDPSFSIMKHRQFNIHNKTKYKPA